MNSPSLKVWLLILGAATLTNWSQPFNDDLWLATELNGTQVVDIGSNIDATFEPGEPVHGDGMGVSVWWAWTAPIDGGLTLLTEGSEIDTVLALYSGTDYSDLSLRAINDDDELNNTTTSRITLNVRAGETLFIAVDSYDGATGFIQLSLDLSALFPTPPNDDFADAFRISDFPASVSGTNIFGGLEENESLILPKAGGASIWWVWTSPRAVKVSVSTEGSSFDTILGVYTGSALGSLAVVAANDDADGTTSAVKFTAQPGITYYIAVDGYQNEAGVIQLSISDDSPKPAPFWQITDLNGQTISSTSLRGKVYVLNFWATWCNPCIVEIPDLISLFEQYKDDGLMVIGPSIDNAGLPVVRPFVSAHAMTYPVGMSTSTVNSVFGGISSIPATFIVDRDGLLHESFVGTQTFATFESAVLPLLFPPVEPPISLSTRIEEDAIVLSWPGTATGYAVISSTDLQQWNSQEHTAALENGNWIVRLPPAVTKNFYRLRK